MITYRCERDNIETKSSVCPVCGERTTLIKSELFWCDECNVPTFDNKCECCGSICKPLTTDLRPVFPEERLLVEIALGEPFKYLKDSVWNASSNRYYVNGKAIKLSVKKISELDPNFLRAEIQKYSPDNTYKYFDEYKEKYIRANTSRYDYLIGEAMEYIRSATIDAKPEEMFISFSGGKDSTVTADLVTRALANPKILHIFGDTTLEFPETYEYVKRFKTNHPGTPMVSSRNKEKDFEELCKLIGPPSRVMRWCCTIFKTGSIQRKISALFKNQKRIITFYGIRRSESTSRSKYERESESPKITKQITISPVIDWMDYDIWLYLLTTGIDFNNAYRLGYSRVGCWCCPNNGSWSECLSKIYMPEQYNHFRNMLIDFARDIGKPDAENYVDGGFWKARQGGNGVAYADNTLVEFTPCALEENAINFALKRPISEDLYELFKPFGKLNFDMGNKRLGEVYVISLRGVPILKLSGRIGSKDLKVTILDYHFAGCKNRTSAEGKVRCQLTKYQMCMACLACESVCKHNAISITQNGSDVMYKINDEKCVRCTECVNHFNNGCYMKKVLAIKKGD